MIYFEIAMIIAISFFGAVIIIDHLFWKNARVKAGTKESQTLETSKSLLPYVIVILIVRSFIVEPFRIPSGSMMPTLLVGDFILVNKFQYGLKLPLTYKRITKGEMVKRGDVITFRSKDDPTLLYIKRVIGLAGESIKYQDKQLTVNGHVIPEKFNRLYEGQGDDIKKRMQGESVYDVTGNGYKHSILENESMPEVKATNTIVPDGQYFVMGDNRDHSNDSRYWGFVPDDNILGQAFMVWLSWDWSENGSGLNLSRSGTTF